MWIKIVVDYNAHNFTSIKGLKKNHFSFLPDWARRHTRTITSYIRRRPLSTPPQTSYSPTANLQKPTTLSVHLGLIHHRSPPQSGDKLYLCLTDLPHLCNWHRYWSTQHWLLCEIGQLRQSRARSTSDVGEGESWQRWALQGSDGMGEVEHVDGHRRRWCSWKGLAKAMGRSRVFFFQNECYNMIVCEWSHFNLLLLYVFWLLNFDQTVLFSHTTGWKKYTPNKFFRIYI